MSSISHVSNGTVAARAVLLLCALACVGSVALKAAGWLRYYQPSIAVMMILAGVLGGTAFVYAGLLRRESVTRRIGIEVVILCVALLGVEILITARTPEAWTQDPAAQKTLARQFAAQQLGIPFDARTISEVVMDLRASGVDALPGPGREWLTRPDSGSPQRIFPLSQASNAHIVECNEGGKYLVYQTDEFGLNNPAGLIASGPIDIAVVGESHALGHCVPYAESLVGHIRSRFPRTANFALAGTHSLSQLASLREFVEPLRPPLVVWTLNAAFADPAHEASNPTLIRYLDPGFSQGLIQRQDKVDSSIRKVALASQAQRDRQTRRELERAREQRFSRVMLLPRIRSHLGPDWKWSRHKPKQAELDQFAQIMKLARQTVTSWNGTLVVLLLPDYFELTGPAEAKAVRRDRLIELIGGLGIPIVDGEALFAQQADPVALYTLRLQNHPNAEGYKLLADRLLAELSRYPPSATHVSATHE